MIAEEIAASDIPVLTLEDTGDRAGRIMDEFKVSHIPVIADSGAFKGLLSESVLFDMVDWNDSIQSIQSKLLNQSVKKNNHVIEVFNRITIAGLDAIAVVDEKGLYFNTITLQALSRVVGSLPLVADQGGLIELEINVLDYAASQIAQIVESENARILGMYVTGSPDSKKMRVTLKLNKRDLSSVIASFERFNYDITASYHLSDEGDQLRDNFDNLMNYINM